eukprot:1159199-Pelagomonas_calceolata.AAC.1
MSQGVWQFSRVMTGLKGCGSSQGSCQVAGSVAESKGHGRVQGSWRFASIMAVCKDLGRSRGSGQGARMMAVCKDHDRSQGSSWIAKDVKAEIMTVRSNQVTFFPVSGSLTIATAVGPAPLMVHPCAPASIHHLGFEIGKMMTDSPGSYLTPQFPEEAP